MPGLFRLTILPYLQIWERASRTLQVNVVLYPIGDPRSSLTGGLGIPGPAIADASIVLTASLSRTVGQLPIATSVDHTADSPLVMPPERLDVFNGLDAAFHPSAAEMPPVRTADKTLTKYLTKSYREAFAFVQ